MHLRSSVSLVSVAASFGAVIVSVVPGGHILARCIYCRTGPDHPDTCLPKRAKPRRSSWRGREYDHNVEVRVR